MNQDAVLHAQIAWLLHGVESEMIRHVHAALSDLHPGWPCVAEHTLVSRTRLHSLQTAIAWHHDRPDAHRRLMNLDRACIHLYKRAVGNTNQQTFVARLHGMIWIDGSDAWRQLEQTYPLQNPDQLPIWADLAHHLDLSNVPVGEHQRWRDEAHLALAHALLSVVAVLYVTRPLQQDLLNLTHHEGGWAWL